MIDSHIDRSTSPFIIGTFLWYSQPSTCKCSLDLGLCRPLGKNIHIEQGSQDRIIAVRESVSHAQFGKHCINIDSVNPATDNKDIARHKNENKIRGTTGGTYTENKVRAQICNEQSPPRTCRDNGIPPDSGERDNAEARGRRSVAKTHQRKPYTRTSQIYTCIDTGKQANRRTEARRDRSRQQQRRSTPTSNRRRIAGEGARTQCVCRKRTNNRKGAGDQKFTHHLASIYNARRKKLKIQKHPT